jgi:hypothetical protein
MLVNRSRLERQHQREEKDLSTQCKGVQEQQVTIGEGQVQHSNRQASPDQDHRKQNWLNVAVTDMQSMIELITDLSDMQ